MKTQKFIEYTTSQPAEVSILDPHWNEVKLFAALDYRDSQGKAWYRDYSPYSRRIIRNTGTKNDLPETSLALLDESSDNYLADPLTNTTAYTYFNNKLNHASAIASLNVNEFDYIEADRLIVDFDYNSALKLGTADFTIEASFYVEEVNLPWNIQTIVSQGTFLVHMSNYDEIGELFIEGAGTAPEDTQGWGIYIKGADLKFCADRSIYTIQTNIQPLTWYHVAIQREGSTLSGFINGTKIATYENFDADISYEWRDGVYDKFNRTLGIGAASLLQSRPSFSAGVPDVSLTGYTSMSGGIGNVRITGVARYPQDLYTLVQPFPNYSTNNPIDPNYADTIYYLPATLDYFDYSSGKNHFTNSDLVLSSAPRYDTGYLQLDSINTYTARPITTPLGATWTIEWETTLFFDNEPIDLTLSTSPVANRKIFRAQTFSTLINRGIENLAFFQPSQVDMPVLELTNANGDRFIKITATSFKNRSSFGNAGFQESFHFNLKVSTDGTTWLELPSNVNRLFTNTPATYISNEDIIFCTQYNRDYNNGAYTNITDLARSSLHAYGFHIAIQHSNSELQFFINGVLTQTIPFNYTLYNLGGDTILNLGGYHDTRSGGITNRYTNDDIAGDFTLGIRNLRISNTTLYSIADASDLELFYKKVVPYPLKTPLNGRVPARGRIVDIVREDNQLTSLEEVSWLVYVNRFLANLVTDDFTLTELEGVENASIVSLDKVNPYAYRVTASTGEGNGTLTLNFVDRQTVLLEDNNQPISDYLGELSLIGETYTIKKTNPLPVLSSGSSPYVKEDFFVFVQFDANIATFDTSKIGIQNAIINRVDVIDEINALYRLTIRPTKEGVISIQALGGAGITDSGLLSIPSEVFVRVFRSDFVILQLPLDVANNRNDLSAARLSLDPVIEGNESYSIEAPTGMSNSLEILPASETSGFSYDFNAVEGLAYLSDSTDWTIEWFSRTNTVGAKYSHLFSIENGNLGFCVYMYNTRLYIVRNYSQKTNILPTFTLSERDTSSFVAWDDSAYSIREKYPHFAITKEDDVYRFYRNGVRLALLQNSANIDIRQGDLRVGYYKNYVDDVPSKLSNIRLTYGKALYTSQFFNVPQLPYTVPINILDEAELVNNITVFSDNNDATLATVGNRVYVRFNTIAPVNLTDLDVTINEVSAQIQPSGIEGSNQYLANVLVDETTDQGFINLVISIDSVYAPLKTFTDTTDGSDVFIDYGPTTVAITSSTENSSNYIIDLLFSFNKPIDNFTSQNITVSGGSVANLQAINSNTSYRAVFIASASGPISISIPENTITDRAGNFNTASNIFNRTVAVPSYVPDPYWNNVVALIQDDSTIVETVNNYPIDTNCLLSNVTAPVGLTQSIHFDGVSNYLSFDTGLVLSKDRAYTIELWCYVSNSSIIRLAAPTARNATNVTETSFSANWEIVDNAASYLLDVAYDNQFINKLPGYNRLPVGNLNTIEVSGELDSFLPVVNSPKYVSSQSVLIDWDYNSPSTDTTLGYSVQLALDPEFSNILYQYDNSSIKTSSILLGDTQESLNIVQPTTETDTEDQDGVLNSSNISKGVILSGLYSTDSFPSLLYFKEESSIRWYKDDSYGVPAIADDIDIQSWKHVAIVNEGRFTHLYVDGSKEDTVLSTTLPGEVKLGYNIGHFEGYITGFRLTKDVARYTGDSYDIPTLPYATS